MTAPFFIVGSARSGTTLLRLILNAHSEVAIPPESRFITELWRDGETSVDNFLKALSAHARFQAWDLPIESVRQELEGASTAEYRDLIEAAFKAFAREHGKARWGDKTPRYVAEMERIASLWPEARFIHMIRDGRNVAQSYADVPFGPKNVARVADLWARRVRAGRESGARLGPTRYLEVRYEDLVKDLETHTKALCTFLELEFDPGMLDYAERSRADVLPRAGKYNPHLTSPPIADVRSWENQMPPNQVAIFEAIAGDLLSDLSYERRYEEVPSRAKLAAKLGLRGLPVGRLKPSRVRTTS